MNTNRQILINQRTTARTSLGCISRVNQYYTATGALCLIRSEEYQLLPRGVSDGFGQAVVSHHSLAVQLLKNDYSVVVNDATAKLMSKVFASIGYSLVNMRDSFASMSTLRRSLLFLRQFPLCLCQRLLIGFKEAGIGDFIPSRQGSKALQPNINTHSLFGWWQWFRFYLTRKAGIPFAGAVSPQSECLRLAFQRAMDSCFNLAYFSSFDRIVLKRETKLGIGQAVISAPATEARIARLFTSFNSSKKGFEGKVNPFLDILERLRIDHRQRRAVLLPLRQKCIALIQADRLLLLLPGILAQSKRLIKNPPAFLQHLTENMLLLGCWGKSVFKGLTHILSIAFTSLNIKRGGLAHSSPALKCGAF